MIGLFILGCILISCTATKNFIPPKTEGLSFYQAVKMLNTPEKVNNWTVRNLGWTGHRGRASAAEMFKKRRGNCFEWANFAAYILDFHGYETLVVFAEYAAGRHPPFPGHALCAHQKDGKWYIAGDSRRRLGAPEC